MINYQKMYAILFNAITDAIGLLQEAQLETEEMYISAEQTVITPLHTGGSEEI